MSSSGRQEGPVRVPLMLRLLRMRRELARRECWTRAEVLAHQQRALRALRARAEATSPFYRRFHRGLEGAPLDELPVLTKGVLMEHFDEVVTDREVRLADVRAFQAVMRGAELFRGRYYVAGTAGTTGRSGTFVWDLDEWAGILASYSRPYAWAGALRLTRRSRMAVVGSTTPWHQSALVGATVDSPLVATLRLDSGAPLEELAGRLDDFRPDVLVGYASMLRLLAAEQAAGRLHLAPGAVFSASEVLTAGARRALADAWGREPFDVYAATETAGIASECAHHAGLHLFEDLVITEVVDDRYRPVPRGEFGSRLLVTVLGSRTIPLVRYEISDSVRLSPVGACRCGLPFARIDGVQGREQEALTLPGHDGRAVTVQPVVFHRVMDPVPAAAWQVVHGSDGLVVLVVGLRAGYDPDRLAGEVQQALARVGVGGPAVRVEQVPSIPRTALGKAPLIRSVPT